MGVSTFKCPHCGNKLGTNAEEYLYGSPIKVCKHCKKTYIDSRYHEIAIEGIRQKDINPTEEDRRESRKSAWGNIGLGVGMFAAFILILFTGWIIFPLPIIGYVGLSNGIRQLSANTNSGIEKKRIRLEQESRESHMRLQNPQYVYQLQALGYNVSSVAQQPAYQAPAQPVQQQPAYQAPAQPVQQQQAQQKFCGSCGTKLGATDRFCPVCGAKVN